MAKKGSKKKRKRRQQVYLVRFIFALFVILILGAAGYFVHRLIVKISENAGPKEVQITTLTVKKDGSIDEILVEDFDESVYDETQLMNMINEEISRYGRSVKFQGLDIESGVARLTLTFENDDTCASFNGTTFYADTVDALKQNGVELPGEALLAGGSHAVVSSGDMDIIVPKKIKYATPGVTLSGKDKTASARLGEDAVCVIVY